MTVRIMLSLILILLLYLPLRHASPSIINTSISCDKTDFLLRIKFNDSFSGSIFTEKGEPNCVYLNATMLKKMEYDVKIPLMGCETKKNDEGNLENEIIVQSGPSFDTKVDKKYLLTCIPASPIFRDTQVTVSFGGVTVDSQVTTAATIVNSQKVEYHVLVRDGDEVDAPPLSRPLAVGDKVTYTVQLDGEVKGRIGRCWASDGHSELELSDEKGCSTQRSGQVWGDFEVIKNEKGTIFLNHIKAWAFPTSNEVNIFCNLHVCATCEQPSCRNRLRRFHFFAGDIQRPPPSSSDDLTPPISLHTAFRLRRESPTLNVPQAALTESPRSSSSFPHVVTLLLLLCLL